MVVDLIGIVQDKYMFTDIDTIRFDIKGTSNETEISMFESPEDSKYSVFFSNEVDSHDLCWVMVVNPKAIMDEPNPILPDIEIRRQNENLKLEDVIKELM